MSVATSLFETRFVPADVGDQPPDFEWEGAEYYIGPVEEITPYIKWLGNKTTCGVQTICSGVMLWGARRLERFVPAAHNFELAAAGFVGQTSRYAVDVQAGPMQKVPDGPKELAAMVALNTQLRRALDMDEWWISYYQPVMELSHLVHLTRHILPGSHLTAFDAWLAEVVRRVDGVAPKPSTPERGIEEFPGLAAYADYVAPHRGQPLPPDILDTGQPFEPDGHVARAIEAAQAIRATRNRYLRTESEVAALEAEAGEGQ